MFQIWFGPGYQAALTEDPGLGARGDLYALKRLRVSGADTPATLLAALHAAGA